MILPIDNRWNILYNNSGHITDGSGEPHGVWPLNADRLGDYVRGSFFDYPRKREVLM